MAAPTSGPCAYCDSPGKTLKCDLCAEAPTQDLKHTRTTFFCNEECKNKIWNSHQKDTCKAGSTRKALKLFADTLQKAWLIICKEKSTLVRFEVQQVSPKELHVRPGRQPDASAFASGGIFHAQPGHTWPTLSSSDRAAILTAGGGNRCDAFVHCDEMVKAYVAGLCDRIEEVLVEVKNPERIIALFVRDDVQKNKELTVLKVTLKHGAGQFVINLSGAQFGFYDSLMPYPTFCERHARDAMRTEDWGEAGLQKYQELCIYKGPLPPVLTSTMPMIIVNRVCYISEDECVEFMNIAMKARGFLATMNPEKVNEIIISGIEWQKGFLTNVEVSIARAVGESKGRFGATMKECMMRFARKDPRECPPFRGYGNFLSYDGCGSRRSD